VELVVAEVPDGEVSPFLVHDLRVGDAVEIHGPLGAFFVWRPPSDSDARAGMRAVQLVAGGSGVVPLLAIARSHVAAGDTTPMRLLYSVRTPSDVFFPGRAGGGRGVRAISLDLVYTRSHRPGGPSHRGGSRIPASRPAWSRRPGTHSCSSAAQPDSSRRWPSRLVDLGHRPSSIRTERFGGT
jgi:hypothetical protein